jgi:anaerobic ribonucleoside-triphosphate reductase activating protein
MVDLRLHALVPRSRANGPGLRTALWVQGCTLGCPGCCNPGTHAGTGGFVRSVRELADAIRTTAGIEGVTLSGGEPFEQAPALLALLERLRATTTLSLLVFSGYTRAEIEAQPLGPPILALIDVLIAGRFDRARPIGHGLLASGNQRVWLLSDRYQAVDLARVPEAEVQLRSDGSLLWTGIAMPGRGPSEEWP